MKARHGIHPSKIFAGLFALAFLTCAGAIAFAHSDEYFDRNPSPHGGQVRMAGAYHFELVVNESELLVYVTDHADRPVATTGSVATATVTSKRGQQNISLSPHGGNLLRGEARIERVGGVKIQLAVTMAGKRAEKASFTPFR